MFKSILFTTIVCLPNFLVYSQSVNQVIGTQIWMTKNLNVSTFRNGDEIPEAKTEQEWVAAGQNKQPVWCYYNNDEAYNAEHGKLYNWYAVNDPRGLAPVGYHVPSSSEWKKLEEYLGGDNVIVGNKMKSIQGWYSSNCSNNIGFNGLPSSYRNHEGLFGTIGKTANWWSSSSYNSDDNISAWYEELSDRYGAGVKIIVKSYGFSVRCLSDEVHKIIDNTPDKNSSELEMTTSNKNNSPNEVNREANSDNESDSSGTGIDTFSQETYDNLGIKVSNYYEIKTYASLSVHLPFLLSSFVDPILLAIKLRNKVLSIPILFSFIIIGLFLVLVVVIFLVLVVVIILLKRKNKEKSRIKAEEEARINAEKEEAKRKADEQSRIKAEQDAKLKEEEEARIKAEKEEAKLKAEEQARIKAERDAKRKAEEESRIKAEKEEAKRKAEEQARIELENNSYYYEIIENESVVIKGPFSLKQMEKLLQKNEISLLTKVKFGLNKKILKPLKEFKEFTTGLEDFL